ncbi:hypothetical protein [Mycoplasma wenyonii]|uniref:hypothetical protein n=1 Tax=Mycoplasma wenyonii TaxID=65123 RepID=UPI0011BCFC28|nr:hypothetical protein [Mycoplasma wenyonii]
MSGVGVIGGTQFASLSSAKDPNLTTFESVQEDTQHKTSLETPTQPLSQEPATTNFVITVETQNQTLEPQLTRETIPEESPKGNCSIIDDLEQVIKELELTTPYIAVFCKIEGYSGFDILGDKWTGLLPLSLLKQDKWGFEKGREMNIMAKTDHAETENEGDYEETEEVATFDTVFSSQQFIYPEIIGSWDYGSEEYDGKLVDFVTLKKLQTKEKIYFVHVD